uniref:Uncharacterized protein n=1 Tax=Myotis myotis TaxID=51298 RepID=A0A7J7XHT1_MYOMY|nr:hypothetical protein mMyoMyo1_011799 [Myotis myotis]
MQAVQPVQGAAAARAVFLCLRRGSLVQPTPIRGAAAAQASCPCPSSSSHTSSLPNLRNSSYVSSLPPSEEQQFCERPDPIQGAVAANTGLRSSNHTSRPPTSEEWQLYAARTGPRSRVTTACTRPTSRSRS